MRKVIIALLALMLIALPLTAGTIGASKKDSVGLGLNIGTNTGLGVKYGFGDFDLLANIGLADFRVDPFALGVDAALSYQVYDIEIDRNNHMPVTVGIGGNVNFVFDDKAKIDVSLLVPVGIEYTFNKVPFNLYLRLAPGVQIFKNSDVDFGFDFQANIGVLYMFGNLYRYLTI